ncbi:MAG: OmpA family protein [Bacteroidales bacterium]|nr:OmpA family protein [Bacteroidales bacterium]
MKKLFIVLISLVLVTGVMQAQILERAKDHAKNKVNNKIDNEIDNGIDKGINKVEDGIEGNGKRNSDDANAEVSDVTDIGEWRNYSFIPCSDIMFYDLPGAWEEIGEKPSQWKIIKGKVEVKDFNGINVISLYDEMPEIVPDVSSPEKDYLPESFSLEFDYYRPSGGHNLSVYLFDRKHQTVNGQAEIKIGYNYVSVGSEKGNYNGTSSYSSDAWAHVAIHFDDGELRIYMNEERVIDISDYGSDPTGITLQAYYATDKETYYLKNICLAVKEDDFSDQLAQNDEIIAYGISFTNGTAELRKESMGSINKIYSLMMKDEDLSFTIEGHTDNFGDDKDNKKLSEQRAETVMNVLVQMGIDSKRLKAKGYGESKPVAGNSTEEDKAKNRRIVFVKK